MLIESTDLSIIRGVGAAEDAWLRRLAQRARATALTLRLSRQADEDEEPLYQFRSDPHGSASPILISTYGERRKASSSFCAKHPYGRRWRPLSEEHLLPVTTKLGERVRSLAQGISHSRRPWRPLSGVLRLTTPSRNPVRSVFPTGLP
jgi:hypothetical protein